MAKVSATEYAAWLARADEARVVVVALTYYEALLGMEAVEMVSDVGYITRPTDTPASWHALGIVTQLPTFSRKLSDSFTGQIGLSFGDLEIDNSDGARDTWLLRNWDGRQVQLWLASPDWDFNDFPDPQLAGVIEGITAPAANRLRFRLRDKLFGLNRQMQASTSVFTDGPNAGRPSPLTFGEPFNVEPVLEDATTYTYRLHDGGIGGIRAVRESGADVPFQVDAIRGRFSLLASPAGRITCDPEGSAPRGATVTSPGALIQHMARDYGGLAADELDVGSLAALDGAIPGPVGLFYRDRVNAIQALTDVATGVGGWLGFSRAGLLQVGRIELDAETYDYELTDDDVLQPRGQAPAMAIERIVPPKRFTWIGYARNFTVQTDGIVGGVEQDDRDRLGKEWLDLTTVTSSAASAHLLATDPQRFESIVQRAAQAALIAPPPSSELQTAILTVTVKLLAYGWDIGRRVLFTSSRFGLAAGWVFTIVGMDDDLNRRQVTVRLLGTLPDGYTPVTAEEVEYYLGLSDGGALLLASGGRLEVKP